jgi:hypothetical protein
LTGLAELVKITANGGFFLTNMFSFLDPTTLVLRTPPELQAYGWTTADLWCAPLITGLYALLTHAQPFWADAHALLGGLLGGVQLDKGIEAVDPEVARAVCALLLGTLFVGRTTKNFNLWKKPFPVIEKGGERGTILLFITSTLLTILVLKARKPRPSRRP